MSPLLVKGAEEKLKKSKMRNVIYCLCKTYLYVIARSVCDVAISLNIHRLQDCFTPFAMTMRVFCKGLDLKTFE